MLIRVVEGIISVPYSIPGIILGLALILTWARPLPIINRTIYATVFMLLVSYVVRFTSLQIRNSTTGVLQTDVSMEEAAEICGASGFKKWSSVIIPLIFPATISGMGLVFLNALTELTTSSLLWSAGSETLGVVIYNYTSRDTPLTPAPCPQLFASRFWRWYCCTGASLPSCVIKWGGMDNEYGNSKHRHGLQWL